MTPLVSGSVGFVIVLTLAWLRARLDGNRAARRVTDTTHAIEIGLVALLLITLIVLGAAQIFLRNAFDSGLLWADPLMRHIVLWLGALGAALASARMNHITVDALSRVMPARFKPARRFLVYGATALAAWVLTIAALRLVRDERSYGEIAFLGIPTWVLQVILPVAFAIVTYRSLVAIFLAREPAELGEEL